jgi:ferric-dicitrate binding protein FerR (iron transport regulator)
MPTKTSSDDLLRQLSATTTPIEDATLAAARRERVIAHLADRIPTLPARRQKRRRLAWAVSFSSAAVIASVMGLAATRGRTVVPLARSEATSALLALEGSVQVLHRANEVVAPPLARMAIDNADEVVTGEGGRARASMASGAEVDIGPDTKVRLRGDEEMREGAGARTASPGAAREAVMLGAGRVTVRVPKLGPARSFAVETPEATVVVHGTAFSVERTVAPGSEPRTSVDVTEGSVAVRHHGVEVFLRPGDRWSSAASAAEREDADGAGPRAAPLEGSSPKPKSPGSGGRFAGSPVKGSEGGPTSEKNSTLAAENRLLQSAMAARQKGDPRRAADLAADLVARYPASPLVEEARVERMRALLSSGGSAAAEAEARVYLADYPRGFARAEASRILAGASR